MQEGVGIVSLFLSVGFLVKSHPTLFYFYNNNCYYFYSSQQYYYSTANATNTTLGRALPWWNCGTMRKASSVAPLYRAPNVGNGNNNWINYSRKRRLCGHPSWRYVL